MADNTKVVIDVSVNADPAVNSLKNLKAELKAAQSAALNGDGKAAQRVAELRDRMDDLKDATKSLQGSGIERANTGFSMLGEGLRNLDFDKVKIGLTGLKTALASTGIMLIVQAVSYLISNFDSLSKGSNGLSVALKLVGDYVQWFIGNIMNAVNAITDFLDLTSDATRALDEQGEKIKENSDKTKEALSGQIAEFDRQIKVAKAAGKSTVELEKAKQQAIIDTNLAIAREIEAFVRAKGTLDDEKKKLLTASLEAIKTAKTEQVVAELNLDKEKNDKLKENTNKRLAEELAAFNKAIDDRKKAEADYLEYERVTAQQRIDFAKLSGEQLKEAEIINTTDKNLALSQVNEAERFANAQREQAYRDKEKAENLAAVQERTQIAQNGLTAISNLTEIAFIAKKANLKKGSAEEEALAKKQFQINKSIQLAGAIIDGSKAITASLAQSPLAIGPIPNPAGIASLVAAATTTALNIAKIAATQFQSASSGGAQNAPTSLNVGSINTSTSAPTTIAPPSANGTDLDENGNVIGRSSATVKAVVVETEMTDRQKRIERYNNETKF